MYTRSLALLPLALTACVSTYASKGPLAFEDVRYTNPDGLAWPERRQSLPELAKKHGMAEAPTVTYVDLNPSAEKTLVFIHGLGSYLKFWRYQLSHFAGLGYRVIAADMVGYGKSDKPADFPYTMPAMADAYAELLSARGVETFTLVGHSMGGQTALSFAIARPGQARGLVLVSPAGFEKFSRRDRLWFTKVFSTALVKSVDEEGLWSSIRYNNFSRWRSDYAWLVEERARVRATSEFDAYAYANVRSVQGLLETDYTRDNLDRIRAVTLIAFGHEDRLIPNRFMHGGPTEAIMAYGAERIDGAQLEGFDGCGHTLQIDCADAFNARLEAFLQEVLPL
ncbi:MAG: alpha/beta hydrolase [Myxococcota bacterium]